MEKLCGIFPWKDVWSIDAEVRKLFEKRKQNVFIQEQYGAFEASEAANFQYGKRIFLMERLSGFFLPF